MVATVAMAQVKVKKGFPELFPKRPVLSQPAKAAGLNDVKLKGVECFAATQTDANNEPAIHFFKKTGFDHENAHVYLSMNLTHCPEYLEHRKNRS